jgi:hypothetical protein
MNRVESDVFPTPPSPRTEMVVRIFFMNENLKVDWLEIQVLFVITAS